MTGGPPTALGPSRRVRPFASLNLSDVLTDRTSGESGFIHFDRSFAPGTSSEYFLELGRRLGGPVFVPEAAQPFVNGRKRGVRLLELIEDQKREENPKPDWYQKQQPQHEA